MINSFLVKLNIECSRPQSQMFFCGFCEICQKNPFPEPLPKTTPVNIIKNMLLHTNAEELKKGEARTKLPLLNYFKKTKPCHNLLSAKWYDIIL